MIAGRHSEDYQPITWVGRFPIYAATLLVILHVSTMVAIAVTTSILGPSSPWLDHFVFTSESVLKNYSAWQLVTYAFVNFPTIWFAVEMLLLYSFGREIERFLGRKSFLLLYGALVLAGPVALTLLGLVGGPQSLLIGGGPVHFAVFIAFVTLYPRAELMLFRIQMKWVALILFAIYSFAYLASRQWTYLGVLWLECAVAVLMMRHAGVSGAHFESWIPIERDEAPRLPARKVKKELPPPDLHESIDPLLEKISRHGIGSLTKRERQRLEQARSDLLEREKRR